MIELPEKPKITLNFSVTRGKKRPIEEGVDEENYRAPPAAKKITLKFTAEIIASINSVQASPEPDKKEPGNRTRIPFTVRVQFEDIDWNPPRRAASFAAAMEDIAPHEGSSATIHSKKQQDGCQRLHRLWHRGDAPSLYTARS